MRAAVYRGKENIAYEEVADPQVGHSEFLLKVSVCGICGSDLHSYRADRGTPGTIMGHEYAGEVVELGARVIGHRLGERLAVIPSVPCRTCLHCATGRDNLCQSPTRPANGALAEFVALPDDAITFEVPRHLSMQEAAFLEPLSVAVRAVNRADVVAGEPAIVFGLGSIGLAIVAVLKVRGVGPVIGIDVLSDRLELARALGADSALDATAPDLAEQVRALAGASRHRMYEFSQARTVFECSGATAVLAQAVTDICMTSGTVIVVANFERPITLDANALVRKEISVVGSYAYTEVDCREAFELLTNRQVDIRPLLSPTVPLAEAGTVFANPLEVGEVKVQMAP